MIKNQKWFWGVGFSRKSGVGRNICILSMWRYYFARSKGTSNVASPSPFEEKKIKGKKRRKTGDEREQRREEGKGKRKLQPLDSVCPVKSYHPFEL